MLDEVDVWFPDVSVVVDPVEECVSVPVVVDEPGVVPALPHDELHLVVLHSVSIRAANSATISAERGLTRLDSSGEESESRTTLMLTLRLPDTGGLIRLSYLGWSRVSIWCVAQAGAHLYRATCGRLIINSRGRETISNNCKDSVLCCNHQQQQVLNNAVVGAVSTVSAAQSLLSPENPS